MYGSEAYTRRFTVVEDAITNEPNLLCMFEQHVTGCIVVNCAHCKYTDEENRMLWWLERHGCVEARLEWKLGQVGM